MPKVMKMSERTVPKTFKMYPTTVEKVKELQELYEKKYEGISQAKVIDMALDALKKELVC